MRKVNPASLAQSSRQQKAAFAAVQVRCGLEDLGVTVVRTVAETLQSVLLASGRR